MLEPLYDLSVMIPARDAEDTLYDTLVSIIQNIPRKISYEILVADHCSTDGTAEQYQQFEDLVGNGDYTGNEPEVISIIEVGPEVKTVAGVRNRLAHLAEGHQFLFLDSDTELTPAWKAQAVEYIGTAREMDAVSSIPLLPSHGWKVSWIWQNWFRYFAYGRYDHLRKPRSGYLAGAHTLVHRDVFYGVGGFNEALVTGEDVDFSARVRAVGMRVVIDHRMAVIHHGYPKTVQGFFVRESWHGMGDWQTATQFLRSKVAQVAAVEWVLMTLAFVCLTWRAPDWASLFLAGAVAVPVTMSFYKFKDLNLVARIRNAAACWLYLSARGFSLFRKEP